MRESLSKGPYCYRASAAVLNVHCIVLQLPQGFYYKLSNQQVFVLFSCNYDLKSKHVKGNEECEPRELNCLCKAKRDSRRPLSSFMVLSIWLALRELRTPSTCKRAVAVVNALLVSYKKHMWPITSKQAYYETKFITVSCPCDNASLFTRRAYGKNIFL